MRITCIIGMALACMICCISSDQALAELPGERLEYYKSKLPPNADKVISIFGAVQKQQTIVPQDGLTLSKAIKMAGGFSDFAERRKVGVWRSKENRLFVVDLNAVAWKKPGAEDPLLFAGDLIIVVQHADYF